MKLENINENFVNLNLLIPKKLHNAISKHSKKTDIKIKYLIPDLLQKGLEGLEGD